MDRQQLAREIRARAFLTGRFTLRSGATSAVYWDKYRFEAEPALLAAVARGLAGLLPPAYDRLAGLELGGVPLATALALHTGRPALFVRKAAKPYGTANLAEGGFAPGEDGGDRGGRGHQRGPGAGVAGGPAGPRADRRARRVRDRPGGGGRPAPGRRRLRARAAVHAGRTRRAGPAPLA